MNSSAALINETFPETVGTLIQKIPLFPFECCRLSWEPLCYAEMDYHGPPTRFCAIVRWWRSITPAVPKVLFSTELVKLFASGYESADDELDEMQALTVVVCSLDDDFENLATANIPVRWWTIPRSENKQGQRFLDVNR
jgi:hypothetical protein